MIRDDLFPVAFGRGIRENFHVLILILLFAFKGGTFKFNFDFSGPLNERFALDEVAHRHVVLDPRAPRLAPTGGVKDPHFDAEFGARLERLVNNSPPVVGEESGRSFDDVILADIANECAVDTDGLHRLKVFDDAFARGVAGDPIPVGSGADFSEWVLKIA